MKVYINDMLYSLSYALDCVESEIFGVKAHHSERVAYLSVKLGQAYGYKTEELGYLAAAAVLHDNALTEYIAVKRQQGSWNINTKTKLPPSELLKVHCDMGERNARIMPFYSQIKGAILYHHENADGTGPYKLKAEETPIFAQIIHFADQLDNYFTLDNVDEEKHRKIHNYVDDYEGKFFASDLCCAFHQIFPAAIHSALHKEGARNRLHAELPHIISDYSDDEMEAIATEFAKIIDYKSHFTCTHSLGLAHKARQMGKFLGYDEQTCTDLYLAGALHDIGKLTISNEILEKPDKLTPAEFTVMKTHAEASWKILRRISGLEKITRWACMHHEKLDGSGYPLGKTGDELDAQERLMACLDIYQALTEDRPYKAGFSHERAMNILRDMSGKGQLDASLVEAIAKCFTSPAQ